MRFCAGAPAHDALHEDARRVDVVRVELARLDELLDLGDVIRPAVATSGLKLRAVCGRRGCRAGRPSRPPTQREVGPAMPRSSTYGRAVELARLLALRPPCVPTPVGV